MKKLTIIFILLFLTSAGAQEKDTLQLNFEEYLAMVKKYHPLVKQADLVVDEGAFKLLKARGAFDPKIQGELSEKNYKSTEYYNLFNAAFKIPTYYGLELSAKYEENSGKYLNPQNTVPDEGLYAAGISLDVTNGLFLSERMATLRQAKIYREQSAVKRDIQAAEVLYEASATYFEWFAAFQELLLYRDFMENAEFRFRSVKTEFRAGDKPAVDTLEASVAIQNRQIQLQQAELDYLKASLKLSNFLWAENDVPLEITEMVVPNQELFEEVNTLWLPKELETTAAEAVNPKIQYLSYDVDRLQVEKRLRANKLLPDLELAYNFLTNQPDEWQQLNTDDYKLGLKLSVPLFLRKERGDLQLAKLELENSRYQLVNAKQEINNKLKSLQNEIVSYRQQRQNIASLVTDYAALTSAEQRKFELGDSSLFLVNNRENSFISARMKEIGIIVKSLKSQAELLKLTTRF